MNKEKLREQLEHHEAKRLASYICPGGYLTVDVGRSLETNPADEQLGRKIDQIGMGISHDEGE